MTLFSIAELNRKRKPRLLFRLSGVFQFRFADRQFLALLFQLPPRFTRFEAFDLVPTMTTKPQRKRLDRRARALISTQNGFVLIVSLYYIIMPRNWVKIFFGGVAPEPPRVKSLS